MGYERQRTRGWCGAGRSDTPCAMRCWLAALLPFVLMLAGCGIRPQAGAPGPTVHVVQEDIHSGLLVPAGWVWPNASGVAEVSFGDALWMQAQDRSAWRASRLVLWPSDGGFYLKRVGDEAAGAIRAERWRAVAVPLSPTGAAQLQAELARWMRPGPDLAAWGDGAVFRPAVRFHVFASCHDQVAAALQAAGVPLSGSWLPWRSADRFHAEVGEALAELDQRGIRFVEAATE